MDLNRSWFCLNFRCIDLSHQNVGTYDWEKHKNGRSLVKLLSGVYVIISFIFISLIIAKPDIDE